MFISLLQSFYLDIIIKDGTSEEFSPVSPPLVDLKTKEEPAEKVMEEQPEEAGLVEKAKVEKQEDEVKEAKELNVS